MSLEKFSWSLLNSLGQPITGATPTVKVREVSTGKSLDWSDNTFKSSGWTSLTSSMTEVGVTYLGLYEIDITFGSTITGQYQVFMDSTYYSSSFQVTLLDGVIQDGLTSSQTTMLLEMYNLLGLDPTIPLIVTKTSRTAGSINQSIDSTATTTTVNRI